jgi:hypothetical protein
MQLVVVSGAGVAVMRQRVKLDKRRYLHFLCEVTKQTN